MSEHDNPGTEAPSERHREQARLEGMVAQSPDLGAALGLLAGAFVLYTWGGTIGARLVSWPAQWFGQFPAIDWNQWHAEAAARWVSWELLLFCAPLVLAVMAVGLLIGFGQVGFQLSTKPLEVDFSRLLISKGWERLVSLESGIRGMFSVLKMTLILVVTLAILWLRREELHVHNFSHFPSLAEYGWQLALQIGMTISLIAVTLGVTDYFIRWLRQEQKLKMTRDQVKREHKESEGDPHFKAARRRKQRELMESRSVARVPEATVILTNPTHLAVAIKFDLETMVAPQIVAKGAGVFAQNITRIARQHGIPVWQRKPLARALYKTVKVGQVIPVDFYRAVAEILAQVYREQQTPAPPQQSL